MKGDGFKVYYAMYMGMDTANNFLSSVNYGCIEDIHVHTSFDV